MITVFDCAEQMMIQLIPYIPALIGIYLVFEFTGMLFTKN